MNIVKYILEKLNKSKKEVKEKMETLSILDRVFNNKSDNEEDLSFIRPNGPCIYAFYTNKVENAIKVGYTDQHPEKRIEQWKKYYGTGEGEVVCLGYWSAEEFDAVGERVFFWDHAVHEKIRGKNYKQLSKDEFMASLTDEGKKLPNIKFSREFFSKYEELLSGNLSDEEKVELSPELIKDIIEEMKNNIKNGTADFKLYKFSDKQQANDIWELPATYNNTKLQEDCIERGIKAIKEGKKNILMAAVMRFGKTHATYEIIKESPNIKRVIICSAKADVRKAWRDDINHVHFYKDFVFIEVDYRKWNITHYDEKTNKLITEHCNIYDDVDLLTQYKDKTILFFFTLHDLGGSIKSLKSKHKGIFDNEFDLMVVDETHYGSHANLFGKATGLGVSDDSTSDDNEDAKEAIELAKEMGKEIANIKRKQVLQVSGTPYYILASNELVDKENTAIISDVSYTDMLNARNKWAEDNMDKDPSESPYFGVPTLHKIGLKLTSECSKAIKKSSKTDSLTALFEIKDGKLVHEKPIKHLMQSIFGDGSDEKLAFLKNKKVQGNKVCNHTLIVLPRREACVALKKVLLEFLHKDRHVYEIVSGNADFKDVGALNKTLEELDIKGEKSIILTVTKWLTGVSMPCVDSMIFLKNSSSPQDYDQSIFRLCTRRVKTVKPDKDDGSEKELKRINMKENVYLIDFNIDNMFNMLNNSARMKANVEGNPSIERIKELMEDDLKTTPIFCEMSSSNEITSKMHKIDRDDLLKIYTGYNSSKSIADIVNDEIDMSFNSFFANKSIQSIIGKLQVIGDKSKSGEILNDEGNKDGDDEIENIGDTNSDKPMRSVKDSINTVKGNKENKIINEIKRKFKTITKYVLYCNICLDEPCSSFEMFVKQSKEDEHCKQMVKDFGIPLKALEELFNKMDVNSKNKYDCLISNMSILAMDASKDSYEKFSTAIKGLGRIDTNEVITPESIVNKMIDKLSKEDFESAEHILLVNEKQCEFFNGILKKFGKDVAKKCLIVPSSEIGKQLCIKMLKSMNMDDYINMILDIQDLTGDNKKNIKDFLEMNNEDILKMNKGKKFDICLMNPPYNNGLHESFLNKVLDITNNCVSIQPDSYLYKGKNGNKKIKNKFYQLYVNIENIDANKYFDGGFQNRIAILHTSESLQKTIIINGDVIQDLNNISIHFQNKLIIEFDKIVKPLMNNNCGNKWKGTPGSHYKDKFEYNENENSWCVQCVLLRGHISKKTNDGKDKDFYTCITNNENLIESQFIGQYKDLIQLKDKSGKLKLQYYFVFNNENEARNFLNYIKTDFVRACLYLKKKDMNVTWNYIPWFDFSDDVFSKTPKEIDDYLFKKYNISNEIRQHIEEILPDYYNIRKGHS